MPSRHPTHQLARMLFRTPLAIAAETADELRAIFAAGGLEGRNLMSRVRAASHAHYMDDDEDDDEDDDQYEVRDGVAIIGLYGLLGPRDDWYFDTNTRRFAAQVRASTRDDRVRARLLDIDSPGGVVTGTHEASAVVRSERAAKPIEAVSNGMMASAAYWIGSAANQITASPSSLTGSIGVITLHADMSRMYENAGIDVEMLSVGAHKADGNQFEALNAKARATLMERINDMYDGFVAEVSLNRRTNPAQVVSNYGQGKVLSSEKALAAGMVDRVATFDEAFERLAIRGRSQAAVPEIPSSARVETQATAQESRTMKVEIINALIAAGYLEAGAGETEAKIALRAFYQARGVAQPSLATDAGIETVLADLKAPKAAAAGAPTTPAQPANGAPTNQDPSAIRIAERERINDLTLTGRHMGIDQAAIEKAIENGQSVDAAVRDWNKVRAERNPAVGHSEAANNVVPGPQAIEKLGGAAVFALARRLNLVDSSGCEVATKRQVPKEVISNAGSFSRYVRCVDVAAACLQAAGVNTRNMLPEEICTAASAQAGLAPTSSPMAADQSYNTPGMYPNIMSALAGKILDQPQGYSPATFREWAAEIPAVPDFKPKTILQVGENGELPEVPDGHDFDQSSVAEEASWISTAAYGDEFQFTPRMQADDDLGALQEAMLDKATAAEMTLNRLCVNLLVGNPNTPDTNPLFDTGGGGAHLNAILSGSGGAPSATQFKPMRTLLRKQKGVGKKRYLNLTLFHILIPPDVEEDAEQCLLPLSADFQIKYIADNASNPFRNKVTYSVEPQLSDASTAMWYGFADKRLARAIIFAYQQGYEQIKRLTYFWPKSGSLVLKVETRCGAAIRNWRGVVRNYGS